MYTQILFLSTVTELEPISAQLCGDGELFPTLHHSIIIHKFSSLFQSVIDWIKLMFYWKRSVIN